MNGSARRARLPEHLAKSARHPPYVGGLCLGRVATSVGYVAPRGCGFKRVSGVWWIATGIESCIGLAVSSILEYAPRAHSAPY
jgi:hypothetical protein